MDEPVILSLNVQGEHGTAYGELHISVGQGREEEAVTVISRVVREALFRLGVTDG